MEGLSNVPKPQEDLEDNKHKSVDDSQEDSMEETCQQRHVHEDPTTKGNNDNYVRPKAHKWKIPCTYCIYNS